MTAKHVVLIFAYHFPPDPEIGAARPFRFYKYLTKLGYDCKIITAAAQTGTPPPGVVYVPNTFETGQRRGLEWQLERAVRWSLLPGKDGLGWSHHAYRAALEMAGIESGSRVTVISSFPPLGVVLAAWRLARARGWPWIADFRDPLSCGHIYGVTGYHETLYQWLEKKTIHAADAVIANTDVSQQFWQKRYRDQAHKIHLLWNGYDPESRIVAKPLPVRKHKVLSHTGTLYAGRTVGPILKSVDRLIQGRLLPADAVRIRQVGTAEEGTLGDNDVLARAQAQGWLELTGNVPPSEARDITQTSDYLLLIQPQSAVQVPGKLFEYVQLGRPILAFVMPDSPAERILKGSGIPHRCVHPEDSPQRMDQVIAEFLNLPTTLTPVSPWYEENFNGETQTHTLAALIEKTTSRRGRG